jgi:DNA-directed RNA polymerase specialized sigma24 family protein
LDADKEVKNATRISWQLTETAFERLLAALAEDRATAGEKYLLLRKNLVRFFESRGFSVGDDAADEVLNRLARKLEFGEIIENVNTYALGIARMLALELRKSLLHKTSDEIPEIAAAPFDAEAGEKEQKLKCLENCLGELSAENREIIVGYYRGEKREKIENRTRLAENLKIPQNALRNRAVRLRDKLEFCITDCLRKI